MTDILTTETSQGETSPGAVADETAVQTQPATEADAANAGADQTAEAQPDQHTDDSHAHPSDWQYIKIALLLALLTAIEVFTYFESVHNLSDAALFVSLTVLMVLKFGYVAAWFMHLKFDSLLFRRVFQVGIVMALGVYIAMLTAFEIW